MDYFSIMMLHLWTVLPAFAIGTVLLIIKKGTPIHKGLGKVYMVLMFFTAVVSLFLEARVGMQFFNHFGFIHLLSFLTIYTIPTAWIAARKGNIKSHKRKMIILYFAGLIVAGGFTLVPGRYLHGILFG
ncbi:MAG: DUF2306 domain-containing protein [Flavobacteriales bacterium]